MSVANRRSSRLCLVCDCLRYYHFFRVPFISSLAQIIETILWMFDGSPGASISHAIEESWNSIVGLFDSSECPTFSSNNLVGRETFQPAAHQHSCFAPCINRIVWVFQLVSLSFVHMHVSNLPKCWLQTRVSCPNEWGNSILDDGRQVLEYRTGFPFRNKEKAFQILINYDSYVLPPPFDYRPCGVAGVV